jgi:hypothetical protein
MKACSSTQRSVVKRHFSIYGHRSLQREHPVATGGTLKHSIKHILYNSPVTPLAIVKMQKANFHQFVDPSSVHIIFKSRQNLIKILYSHFSQQEFCLN